MEYLRSFLRRHFAGKPVWRREISAVFSGQTGCQPRIPVQGHGSWVPSIRSLSNDDGDVNENGIKAIGLDSPPKKQLCTFITLFCTFFLAVVARLLRGTSLFYVLSRMGIQGNNFLFQNFDAVLKNSTPKIRAIKFEAAPIHFLSDVFVPVAAVVA